MASPVGDLGSLRLYVLVVHVSTAFMSLSQSPIFWYQQLLQLWCVLYLSVQLFVLILLIPEDTTLLIIAGNTTMTLTGKTRQ